MLKLNISSLGKTVTGTTGYILETVIRRAGEYLYVGQ